MRRVLVEPVLGVIRYRASLSVREWNVNRPLEGADVRHAALGMTRREAVLTYIVSASTAPALSDWRAHRRTTRRNTIRWFVGTPITTPKHHLPMAPILRLSAWDGVRSELV